MVLKQSLLERVQCLAQQKRNLEDVFVALTGEQPEIERP